MNLLGWAFRDLDDADPLDIGAFRSIPILDAARAAAMIEGQSST